MNYFFNPKARAEHLEHVVYYQSQRYGLGTRYLAAFTAAMVNVCEAPQRYKIKFPPNIRQYRLTGFPYNILYRHRGEDIKVLAVASHRRRPDYWRERLHP